MAIPPRKIQLIQRLHAARSALETLLDRAGDADAAAARDVLAHITIWDQRGKRWIRDAAAGKTPQMPIPGYTWEDIHTLNARTLRDAEARSLVAVRTDSRRAFRNLVKTVESINAPELKRHVEPHGVRGSFPLWEMIAWRYRHCRAHSREIRALVMARQVAQGSLPSGLFLH